MALPCFGRRFLRLRSFETSHPPLRAPTCGCWLRQDECRVRGRQAPFRSLLPHIAQTHALLPVSACYLDMPGGGGWWWWWWWWWWWRRRWWWWWWGATSAAKWRCIGPPFHKFEGTKQPKQLIGSMLSTWFEYDALSMAVLCKRLAWAVFARVSIKHKALFYEHGIPTMRDATAQC